MSIPLPSFALWFSLLLAAVPVVDAAEGDGAGEDKATAKIEEAEKRFYETMTAAQSRYRKDLAEAVSKGDKVEVYLLDFDAIEKTPSDFLSWETRLEEGEFPIMPYGSKTKVPKKATLTAEQRNEFLPALQKVVGAEENGSGAMCHFPIHGVRVFNGDRLIFQTSFCWHCGNYYVHYPNHAGWEGISNTTDLIKAFEKMMPVPKTEMDRFNAKYGPNRNKEQKAQPTREKKDK